MTDKELLENWIKKCLEFKCKPLVLICVNEENDSIEAFSTIDQALLRELFLTLTRIPTIDLTRHTDGKEPIQ